MTIGRVIPAQFTSKNPLMLSVLGFKKTRTEVLTNREKIIAILQAQIIRLATPSMINNSELGLDKKTRFENLFTLIQATRLDVTDTELCHIVSEWERNDANGSYLALTRGPHVLNNSPEARTDSQSVIGEIYLLINPVALFRNQLVLQLSTESFRLSQARFFKESKRAQMKILDELIIDLRRPTGNISALLLYNIFVNHQSTWKTLATDLKQQLTGNMNFLLRVMPEEMKVTAQRLQPRAMWELLPPSNESGQPQSALNTAYQKVSTLDPVDAIEGIMMIDGKEGISNGSVTYV